MRAVYGMNVMAQPGSDAKQPVLKERRRFIIGQRQYAFDPGVRKEELPFAEMPPVEIDR